MRKTIRGKAKDFLLKFDLSAIGALKGDGKMEVILEGSYSYGGSWSEIYESARNSLNEVLAVECGD